MKQIENISFCIRSTGERERYLKRAILSIHLQEIDVPYEVLVCGWTELDQNKFKFRLIEDKDDALNSRLGKMLDKLAENAQYELLVFIDDDTELLHYWWHNVKKLDLDLFDLTCFRMFQLQKERLELYRWYDWAEVVPGKSVIKPWDEPANKRTYIGGSSLIIKRDVVLKVKYGELERGEDSIFCFKCFGSGYRLRTFPFMRFATAVHYLAEEGRHKYVKG